MFDGKEIMTAIVIDINDPLRPEFDKIKEFIFNSSYVAKFRTDFPEAEISDDYLILSFMVICASTMIKNRPNKGIEELMSMYR